MRHFFVARAVAALPRGVTTAPDLAILVALSGALDRAAPGALSAVLGTINLTSVAAAADHDLHSTARAEKQPR
jgi:hypothetical protein